MTESFLVTTAELSDLPALVNFWKLAGENDARPQDSVEVVRNLISRDPDAILLVKIDGLVVGSVIAGGHVPLSGGVSQHRAGQLFQFRRRSVLGGSPPRR